MGNVAQLDDPEAVAAAEEIMRPFLDRLDPGHVARFFIGRTKGYYAPCLSVEDVREHIEEIRDDRDYTVPADPADEMAELFTTIMG
ncbi:hypothetical protein ACTXG7_10835 [Mycolicibacterium sp. Dal123E01]|uniref:hypothetical protein n=1 Tax=Mycolicibacterium sp. Dal123E01 TaxID=3457578 RepID=UPI00403EA62E